MLVYCYEGIPYKNSFSDSTVNPAISLTLFAISNGAILEFFHRVGTSLLWHGYTCDIRKHFLKR